MQEPIVTPLSFIAGNIWIGYSHEAEGFARGYQAHVTITAKGSAPTPISGTVDVKLKTRYQLVVPPGTWEVWASVGQINSETKVVEVQVGKIVQIDFAFSLDGSFAD